MFSFVLLYGMTWLPFGLSITDYLSGNPESFKKSLKNYLQDTLLTDHTKNTGDSFVRAEKRFHLYQTFKSKADILTEILTYHRYLFGIVKYCSSRFSCSKYSGPKIAHHFKSKRPFIWNNWRMTGNINNLIWMCNLKVQSSTGLELGIWNWGCRLLHRMSSAKPVSIKNLKIHGCQRWCSEFWRVPGTCGTCANSSPVQTHP